MQRERDKMYKFYLWYNFFVKYNYMYKKLYNGISHDI